MLKNDNPSHPLHYLIPDGNGLAIGQFYNSRDNQYHLAEYVQFYIPPKKYLCGGYGNFSPSRSDSDDRNICHECWRIFEALDDK